MFSIPHRIGLLLAASIPAFLSVTPAHSALGPRLDLMCMPDYAPEGFPCRSVPPGTQLVVRVRDALPAGAVLRFVPAGDRGNGMDFPLSAGPVARNSDYRITISDRMCTVRKGTRFQVQLLTAAHAQAGSAGDFMVMC
ncbi:MAG TPA: hypothetical protein VF757_10140 [Sphingomicrobium sp.]